MTITKKQPQLTRLAILDAADAGFSHKGYAATGIGGIVTTGNLTKGALFHHFSDKCSLAEAWITERLGDGIDTHWVKPLHSVSSLNAFRSICQARAKDLQQDDATSSLVALTAEVAAHDPRLREALAAVFQSWQSAISDLLERGQAAGWIHRSIKPEVEAAFIISSFSGFTIALKLAPTPATRSRFLSAFEGYLETLRGEG